MTDKPLRIAVIVGGTRDGRFGPTVATWFVTQAESRPDLVIDTIDLADADLPAALPARAHPAIDAFTARLDDAGAFVVVTPEYNHSFPASLKQAIDVAQAEWNAKPVALVSYGGISGGLRAAEHLRLVSPRSTP